MTEDEGIQRRIESYVDALKEHGSIRSETVERAFRIVPRHRLLERFFVPSAGDPRCGDFEETVVDPDDPSPDALDAVYSDRALVTAFGEDGRPSSSTSQPSLVAQMLELLELEDGHRVLEIGAGTGYNAALLSEIVGRGNVTTVDIQPRVADRAKHLLTRAGYGDLPVLAQDGFLGAPQRGPFDRIVATVGLPDASPHWRAQLTATGRMLLPVFHGGAAPLLLLHEGDCALSGRVVGLSGFMPVLGEMADPERVQVQQTDPGSIRTVPWWGFADHVERASFWYFLSASDARATLLPIPGADNEPWSDWSYGLRDGGSRLVVGPEHVVAAGDADALIERFREVFVSWDDLGRPNAGRLRSRFVPRDGNERPSGIVLERRYHWQVFEAAA